MNILMVGADTRGSWQMRAVQLGGAIGARVSASPTAADWAWADLVVLVKRAAIQWAAQARRATVPVVWGVLDFWAQPGDNDLTREDLLAKVRTIQKSAGVSVLIGATRAMAEDIGGVYLPHHCRIGLEPGPIRQRAGVVGYDGTRKYLGRWRLALEKACAELSLQLVINPPDLRDVDVLVSFRDGIWDGWACRRWKSGVKHVNAIVAGRPILSQPSSAQEELRPFGGVTDTPEGLTEALGLSALREVREEAYRYSLKTAVTYQLSAVARDYVGLLEQSARRAA